MSSSYPKKYEDLLRQVSYLERRRPTRFTPNDPTEQAAQRLRVKARAFVEQNPSRHVGSEQGSSKERIGRRHTLGVVSVLYGERARALAHDQGQSQDGEEPGAAADLLLRWNFPKNQKYFDPTVQLPDVSLLETGLRFLSKYAGRAAFEEAIRDGGVTGINRIPGMFRLLGKAALSVALIKEQPGGMGKWYPETWCLPDDAQNMSSAVPAGEFIIVKPNGGSLGQGIFISAAGGAHIASEWEVKDKHSGGASALWCCQRYIQNPMLIDGRKFHCRVYAVVCVLSDSLAVHVLRDGYPMICDNDYGEEALSSSCLSDAKVHISNRAAEAHLWDTLAKLEALGAFKKHSRAEVWQCVVSLVADTMRAVHPELSENIRAVQPELSRPLSLFQLLGFDILIDSDANPWLLEANSNPSVDMLHDGAGEVEKCIKRRVVDTALRLAMPGGTGRDDVAFDTVLLKLRGECREGERLPACRHFGSKSLSLPESDYNSDTEADGPAMPDHFELFSDV